jgi:hypothetical protein
MKHRDVIKTALRRELAVAMAEWLGERWDKSQHVFSAEPSQVDSTYKLMVSSARRLGTERACRMYSQADGFAAGWRTNWSRSR